MAESEKYYKVILDPAPTQIGAFQNRARDYRWNMCKNPSGQRCEIAFIQEGSLSVIREDHEETYPSGTIVSLVNNRPYSLCSRDPLIHEFHFIFHTAEKIQVVDTETAANWNSAENEALLPKAITDPTVCRQVAKQIKNMVKMTNSNEIARGLKLRTAIYDCLSFLTDQAVLQARQELNKQKNSPDHLTTAAIAYIREHLSEPLSLHTVAEGIGANYHTLRIRFRQNTETTMTDYIRQERIREAEKLITAEGMTLEEAGLLVGIRDRDYLSRLFHRTTGMTVREYRKVYAARWEKTMNTTQK